MEYSIVHDGERVKARCQELKVLGKVFADEMAWTSRKLYRMFHQADWPTGELQRAGRILGFDFFTAYSGTDHPQPDKFLLGLLVVPEVLHSEITRKRVLEELWRWSQET